MQQCDFKHWLSLLSLTIACMLQYGFYDLEEDPYEQFNLYDMEEYSSIQVGGLELSPAIQINEKQELV